jgi:hypothetical protein
MMDQTSVLSPLCLGDISISKVDGSWSCSLAVRDMAVASCVSGSRSRSSVSLDKQKIRTLRPKVSLASSSDMVQKATSPSPKPEASPFVHQNGPFRLTLNSEQYSSSGRPVYSTGEVITGCLDVSRTSSLRSVELKVRSNLVLLSDKE